MTEQGPAAYALELRNISRAFGHVQALRGVDLELRRGEILGIVGDNGAGKSTLMKIAAGTVKPDEGDILIDGRIVSTKDHRPDRDLGLEMIFQDLALFDNLDVASNIFVGREPSWGIGPFTFVDRPQMHARAEGLLTRLGIKLNSTKLSVDKLSGGQRQMIAIARAIAFEAQRKIVIMDEPSAALGAAESLTVVKTIERLRSEGVAVIVITHRIPEILELADRILVMKGGRRVAVLDARSITVDECVDLIVSGYQRAPRGTGTGVDRHPAH